jgi:hypothetical protein
MMSGEWKGMLRKLSLKKVVNGLTILGSYYFS